MAVNFSRKDDFSYIRWSKEVRLRDHYCCDVCGRKNVGMHAHHKNAWANYPDQRYDIENGVTLCKDCHDRFHDTYGKGQNTEEQYNEFKDLMQMLIKTANENAVKEYTVAKMLKLAEIDRVTKEILADMESKRDSQ